ncbi:hypothetical protein PVAND_001220 [Polypedilum vanderplanki]|uniref:Uncharacterized protein n=1 Tax=Polypedilum vanderplanki TaxID=319348 RepID=A0A9J6BNJ3_POLVA|nr:hypothetical protein PVAND_001220 [Polypedilum vanderplanki]
MCTIDKNSKLYGELTSALQTLEKINSSKTQFKPDLNSSKFQSSKDNHHHQHGLKFTEKKDESNVKYILEIHSIFFVLLSMLLGAILKVTSCILESIIRKCEGLILSRITNFWNGGQQKFTYNFINFKVLFENIVQNFNRNKGLTLIELLFLIVAAIFVKIIHQFVKLMLLKVPIN